MHKVVKEGRERIKAVQRNCASEFPYGQGVRISLAPADIRKEGSAFDVPMTLGLAYVRQFCGQTLNKFMILGEPSLDRTLRSMRGALSATLAARENGLRVIAVPQANALMAPKVAP